MIGLTHQPLKEKQLFLIKLLHQVQVLIFISSSTLSKSRFPCLKMSSFLCSQMDHIVANQISLHALFETLPKDKPECCINSSFKLPLILCSAPTNGTHTSKLKRWEVISSLKLQNLQIDDPFSAPLICKFEAIGILSSIALQQNADTFSGMLLSQRRLKASSFSWLWIQLAADMHLAPCREHQFSPNQSQQSSTPSVMRQSSNKTCRFVNNSCSHMNKFLLQENFQNHTPSLHSLMPATVASFDRDTM